MVSQFWSLGVWHQVVSGLWYFWILPCLFLISGGFLSIFGIPWLVNTPLQSCVFLGCSSCVSLSHLPSVCVYGQISPFKIFLLKKFFFYWHIVDLQYCVNFCCTAMWFSYIYMYIYTHTYTHTHTYMYVCMYVYTLHTHTWSWTWSLIWEDPLAKGMVTHSSVQSHGQRNLAGYRPRDCKESERTERLTLSHFQKTVHPLACQAPLHEKTGF